MWDERYSADEYAYGEEPNDFLKENISYLKKGSVLSLAEGEGRNGVFLVKKGFDVTGVDSSLVAIEKAHRLAHKNKVKLNYIHSNLLDYDFGEQRWDSIISIFAHTPKNLQQNIFAKVRASLVKGGIFLLEGYHAEQLKMNTGGPKSKEMMFDLKELKEAFDGFEIIKAQYIQRKVIEGQYHNGESETIQFICRKK